MMINTREIASEYRLSHWARIMEERVQSGMTVKAYCEQTGICGNTYYYWQRRLREASCEQLMKSSNLPVFREVRIEEPAAPPEPCPQLRISIGGIHMTADKTYPTEKLAELLRNLSC